jgi:capsular polysaccharide biosynthesis protein
MAVHGATGRRRLYVSRSDAGKRRVTNEPALVERLARLGFEAVTLSDRSFEEQVELFRSAVSVVGPHGAGLTNLMFSAEGTVLVELQLDIDQRPHFDRLAQVVGLQYASVVCPGDAASPRDMVADIDQIVSVLESFVGQ